MTVTCAIIDDEYPARILLGDYVKRIPYLELTGTFKNPMAAMAGLQESPADLLFLDIQMPELTGVEFLRSMPQKPVVIFTTAYPDYALEGYELDVCDYLLKPIAFERFVQAANKAAELIRLRRNVPGAAPEPIIQNEGYISVKADHKIYRIGYSEILYIEGLREYVTFHTGQGKIVALESLKNLEEILPSERFMRVHKSYIVNRRKVISLYGNQLEIGKTTIPIGKSYKEEVVKNLFS